MKNAAIFILIAFLFGCNKEVEKIKPSLGPISESVYASGVVKSLNQYLVFTSVSGIVENVFVSEGDTVKAGSPILSVSNEPQRLSQENAKLSAEYADLVANQGKLSEAKLFSELALNKMKSDSALYFRQKSLWSQKIGSKVELEQRQLAYENSKAAYVSSLIRYEDLRRQLDFASSQSRKNLMISSTVAGEFTLRSEMDGIVYSISKSKGEIVNPQVPVAVIGDAKKFVLEMQVDEYDIMKIRTGMPVLVTLDSYKGEVFDALVTKINPLMNERSKTFLVEAVFVKQPPMLYPNINFEANIVVSTKEKALLIPREYLGGDSVVFRPDGSELRVKTGLKDYRKVEILSGLSEKDELIKPR